MRRLPILVALAVALGALAPHARAQAGECVYPILYLHGWLGSQYGWADFYAHPDVAPIWGGIDPDANVHVYHAVVNARSDTRIAGGDGSMRTTDDDALVDFARDDGGRTVNVLEPGCVYAANFENFWNENAGDPVLYRNADETVNLFESDSNESAILKQGYVVGRMIEAVLAANPDKERVILVGHSMGGLAAREYLQRRIPEEPGGTPRWWVEPGEPDGHRVAHLFTLGTPHRGSNYLGNISRADTTRLDGTPDLASEAVRDLRYSYACGFLLLFDCSAPYLYGGDEDDIPVLPYPFWNRDVNADGDSNDRIIGINVDGRDHGGDDRWDGTYDNPLLPLPLDVTYRYYTSKWAAGSGDGIVDRARQWLWSNDVVRPDDGRAWRLADTLFSDAFHLDQRADIDHVARGLDEPDYGAYAWRLDPGTSYAALAQRRGRNVPDGAWTDDPDWYRVELASAADLTATLTPVPGLSGQIDLYFALPDPWTTGDGDATASFEGGEVSLTAPGLPAGTYWVRVLHRDVGVRSWRDPYRLRLDAQPAAGLAVAAEPVGGDVVIPPGGGTFRVDVDVTNLGADARAVDIWTVIELPGGGTAEQGPWRRTIAAGGTFGRRLRQKVPGGAPAGSYTYTAHAGAYPSSEASDGFTFVKEGVTGTERAWALADARTGEALHGDASSILPGGYRLGAAYPNPFNPTARFVLEIDARQPVAVEVFDVLGRRVARLHEGLLEAGRHAFVFDAAALPSGTYFYRASGEAFTATQRMVLLR